MSTIDDILKESPELAEVVAAIRRRTNNMNELAVHRLALDVSPHDPGIAYPIVRKFFKAAERYGAGRLIEGRKGHKTRFLWAVPMLDFVRGESAADLGEPEHETEPPSLGNAEADIGSAPSRPSPSASDARFVQYQHLLRSGCVVRVSLPEDFTAAEAERLCAFIRTLPLETPR